MTNKIPKGNYDCNTYSCSNVYIDNSYLPRPSIDSYNLIKSDITDLIKNIETKYKCDKDSSTLDEEYNTEENRSLKIKRINDYDNTHNFYDNNVLGVKEEINEYIININSVYRDCKIYPNPFNYKVNFNTEYNNNAVISKIFNNIKYIKLIHMSVPKKYMINIITYNIFNENNDMIDFINLFLSKQENDRIHLYYKYLVVLTYLTIPYYFFYYKISVNDKNYYICNYIIYCDKECKHKINFNLNNTAHTDVINNIFNNIDNINITSTTILYNIGNWILINVSNNKFKFCEENLNFNDTINTTFEFMYDNLTLRAYTLQDYSLENDRYFLLDINELNDSQYEYSTDQKIENCFTMLYNDYSFGDYFYLETYYHKIYTQSNLGNISKMSIQLKNIYGNDIIPSILYDKIIDYDITTPKDKCICNINLETGELIRNYSCCHSYLRHPGYEKIQNNLLFKVGVLEGTIKTQRI